MASIVPELPTPSTNIEIQPKCTDASRVDVDRQFARTPHFDLAVQQPIADRQRRLMQRLVVAHIVRDSASALSLVAGTAKRGRRFIRLMGANEVQRAIEVDN